ncbi:MAG: hypothetical protein AABY32_02050 [Nanoarchaeota archaeon]
MASNIFSDIISYASSLQNYSAGKPCSFSIGMNGAYIHYTCYLKKYFNKNLFFAGKQRLHI